MNDQTMSKPDRTAFDAELLTQIKAGNNSFQILCHKQGLMKMAAQQ